MISLFFGSKLTCAACINKPRGAERRPPLVSHTNGVAFWASGLWDIVGLLSPSNAHTENTTMTLSLNGFLSFSRKLPSSSGSRSSLLYVWSFVGTRTKVGISQIALHLWTVPQPEVSFIAGGDREQFCVSFFFFFRKKKTQNKEHLLKQLKVE